MAPVALVRVLERWTHHDADDPLWSALAEFAARDSANAQYGHGFDDGLRDATIRLMLGADHASGERAEGNAAHGGFLTVRTLRELEAADEQIDAELDRIRQEA